MLSMNHGEDDVEPPGEPRVFSSKEVATVFSPVVTDAIDLTSTEALIHVTSVTPQPDPESPNPNLLNLIGGT